MAIKQQIPVIAAKNYLLRHLLLVVIVTTVVLLGAGGLFALHQHQLAVTKEAAAKEYQKKLGQVNTYYSRYNDIAAQYLNLPSTTTKTSAEWNQYFDQLISQLQGVSNDSASAIFTNGKIAAFNKDIQRSCGAFISELNINKSATAMQFQVTAGQNQLSSDRTGLNEERSIYNESVASGFPISNSYVVDFEGRVTSDNTKLSSDQQTSKDQQQQESQAQMATLFAQSIMNAAAKAAGINP